MTSGFLGWTPKDSAQQLQNLARRTTVVAFSKYALLAMAVVLLLLVFIIPAMQDTSTGGARLVFSNIQVGETGKPHMSKPRFQGLDANDQPYELAASSAEQQPDGKILLEDLEASMALAGGEWLMLLGQEGIYDREAEILHLPHMAQVFHDAGYEMQASDVVINLKASTVRSDREIRGHGPLGKLVADGFAVDDEAQTLLFKPNVKVTLYPGTTLNETGNE